MIVLKKLLEKLKASLTDPNPELHEDHAKTRYAQMAREVCEEEASIMARKHEKPIRSNKGGNQ